MAKIRVDEHSGLVRTPVFRCAKGEGLCQLRTEDTGQFTCVYEPKVCRYRKPEPKGNSLKGRASGSGNQLEGASQSCGETELKGDSQNLGVTVTGGGPEVSPETLWNKMGRDKEDG